MTAPGAWRRTGGAGGGRTVLAVDYDTTGRPEATFDQLADLLGDAPLDIWHTVQPPAEVADRLAWWQDGPAGAGPVEAVMGYCVGSVFAAELADRIAERQGSRPALLLFDPEPVDDGSVQRDFLKALDTMTVLSDQERAGYRGQAEAVGLALADDFAAAAAGVVAVYRTAARVAFDRLGLDDEMSEELIDLFRLYVDYLTAAHRLSPEAAWANAVALTSAGSSPGAGRAQRELNFDVGTAALLEDDRVALAVRELLAPHTAAHRASDTLLA